MISDSRSFPIPERTLLISECKHAEDDYAVHLHQHLSCEIIYIEEGEVELQVDRKQYIAKKGCMMFISDLEPHQLTVLKTPYKRFFAMINLPELERILSSHVLPTVFKNRSASFSHVIDLSDRRQYIEPLMHQLEEEYESHGGASSDMFRVILENILMLTYRSYPGNFTENENSGMNGRIMEIQRYIEKNFKEEINLTALADEFYINYHYMSRLFKQRTGYSPKEYITLNRLSYAKELLETTDIRVKHIAYRCGYSDVNNFIRSFKARYGATPEIFRDLAIKKNS